MTDDLDTHCSYLATIILLGNHHSDKFLIVNLTITIDIGFTDHLVNLFVSELLTQVGHNMPQLHITLVRLRLTKLTTAFMRRRGTKSSLERIVQL